MECPHPHKKRYRSQAKAKRGVREMKHKALRPMHVYECPAKGHWHLGTHRNRTAQEIFIDQFWKGMKQ